MTDQATAIAAINEAGVIIAEYLQPGPRDPVATIDRLIEVLDSQKLAAAVIRIEKGQADH
jgi:hypothetical protein